MVSVLKKHYKNQIPTTDLMCESCALNVQCIIMNLILIVSKFPNEKLPMSVFKTFSHDLKIRLINGALLSSPYD